MYEDKRIRIVLDKRVVNGIIVSCEEGIGISIVSDTKNVRKRQYLYCLNLPNSPIYKEWEYRLENSIYNWEKSRAKNVNGYNIVPKLLNKLFSQVVKEIEEGNSLDLREGSLLQSMAEDVHIATGSQQSGIPNKDTCAFGR